MERSKVGGGSNTKKFTYSKWHWKPEEDKLLTKLVQRFGPNNWELIANQFQGRSGKSCRLRWVNQLNPQVNKKPFSEVERHRLLHFHKIYGNKWSMLSKYFPGRTDNQLKNQYHVLVGSRSIKDSCRASNTNAPNIPKQGSENTPQFESASTTAFASEFSNVYCYQGHTSSSTPCLCAMPHTVEMPVLSDDVSSINGMSETWFAAQCSKLSKFGLHSSGSVNIGNIYFNQKAIQVHSLISDAHSSEIPDLLPVVQPQHGGYAKDCQFIDFFGVGKQE